MVLRLPKTQIGFLLWSNLEKEFLSASIKAPLRVGFSVINGLNFVAGMAVTSGAWLMECYIACRTL